MSLLQLYRNLPFKGRLGFGAGLVLWGTVGLFLSDTVEEKFGFTPTEADKAALDRAIPKIHVVESDRSR